ncbi:MAG: hypothetical protein KDK24_09155 [Pseudooceanicola sp.]|nr:hypothetical protein [Pseudooceanicola sp.]
MKPTLTLAAIATALTLATPALAEFRFSFDWAGLKSCTSGNPNTVHNPLFKVSGVPQGTTVIRFQLKDLDVPGYNHGGGYVTIAKDGTVPAKSFKYKSPCPPSGKHTYEWTATAMTRKNGKALAKAAARASYP